MKKFVNYFVEEGDHAGKNISWGSIFAGVVTFIAIFITLSMIGSAIGFGMIDPTTNGVEGVGTGVTVWTVIAFILSFICAGFIAGVTAQRVGLVHGFLTWATTLLAIVILVSYTAGALLSGAGSIIGSVASVAGDGVSKVAEVSSNVASSAFDGITDSLSDIDTQKLDANIKDVLRDTDTKELQPEYINSQLREAAEEVKEAGKQILTNPDSANEVVKNLSESLKQRGETIVNAVDRDAIASAVAKNTELTEQEAKEATDNIYNGIQEASKTAEQKLNEASDALVKAQAEVEQKIEDAKVAVDEATDAVSGTSIWAFVGLVLSMILTSVFGVIGANLVKNPNYRKNI